MSESFTVVARYDEAIDALAMTSDDRDGYRETFDIALLKYVEGERPTLWHCRRLRVSEMRDVLAQPHDSGKFEASFCRGLVRVDGLRTEGGRQAWTKPTDKPLTDKLLDIFDPADVQEVGAAIFGRSHLGKGRPAAWPLPATSRLALEALVLHRAAGMRRSDRSRQSSERAAEASATPPDVSPDSATSGDATATGPAATSLTT